MSLRRGWMTSMTWAGAPNVVLTCSPRAARLAGVRMTSELRRLMLSRGLAVHEESLLTLLLADLRESLRADAP